MNIKYINKTTLIDFPKTVAATIWIGGCNFNCDYCYNKTLVNDYNDIPSIPVPEVLAFIESRKHVLEGVVISGGEPTLEPDLKSFIQEIKTLGLKIKLDTNGYSPSVIQELNPLLDYIAMDIKAPEAKYSSVVGLSQFDMAPIKESIKIIKTFKNYEFRTTLWKDMLSLDEFEQMLNLIEPCNNYFLQNYYKIENDQSNRQGLSKQEIEPFLTTGKKYIKNIQLRGNFR